MSGTGFTRPPELLDQEVADVIKERDINGFEGA